MERRMPARNDEMQRKVANFGLAVEGELRRMENAVQAEVQVRFPGCPACAGYGQLCT